MVPHQDRVAGLVFGIVNMVVILVATFIGAVQYAVMAQNRASSEVPGLIFIVCAFVVASLLPNVRGSVAVWRGKLVGYRILSIFNGLMSVTALVAINRIFLPIYLPIFLLSEMRFRALRDMPDPSEAQK